MRKLLRIVPVLLVLVVGIGSIAILGANKPQAEKKKEEPRLISLAVEKVNQQDVVFSVTTQGEAAARTEVDLVPQVSGRITKVSPSFAEGGAFKAGEVLIQIDDRDYKLSVTRAKARVAEAQVRLTRELANSEIKKQQWERWMEEGDKPTDLALNKPQVEEAQAKLMAAKADLEDAELDLSRTRITLPYDGRVRTKMADVGQFVNAGSRLGRVFSTEMIEVKLPLTDVQMAELGLPIGYIAAEGNEPKVELSAIVAGQKRVWEGKLVRTHAAVDNSTRLVYAVAAVENPYEVKTLNDMPLAVGLFVNAKISGFSATPSFVMPRVALRKGNEVIVVDANNELETRKVQVLATDAEQLYVASGVQVGDRVVVSSVQKVVDGMKVSPYERTDAARTAVNAAR